MRHPRSIARAMSVSERRRGPSTFAFHNLPPSRSLRAFSSWERAIPISKPPLSLERFHRRLLCRLNQRLRLELRWSLHLWVYSLFFALLPLTTHCFAMIWLVWIVGFCISHFIGVLVGTGSRLRFGPLFRKRVFRRRILCIRSSFTKVGLFTRGDFFFFYNVGLITCKL